VSGPAALLFGKLPRHGDFVARGLDAAAREAWDHWAASGLEAAREALGEDFEAAHETMPSWRFVDQADGAWRAGALAASIDSVGRRFVIVLAAQGLSAGQAAADGEALAERFEGLIHRGFMESLTADDLAAVGAGLLVGLEAGGGAPFARWWTEGGGDLYPVQSLPGGLAAEELFVRMMKPAEAVR
jgi:type VI secretion system protein ImpM